MWSRPDIIQFSRLVVLTLTLISAVYEKWRSRRRIRFIGIEVDNNQVGIHFASDSERVIRVTAWHAVDVYGEKTDAPMGGSVTLQDGQNGFVQCYFKTARQYPLGAERIYKVVLEDQSRRLYPPGYLYKGVFRNHPRRKRSGRFGQSLQEATDSEHRLLPCAAYRGSNGTSRIWQRINSRSDSRYASRPGR